MLKKKNKANLKPQLADAIFKIKLLPRPSSVNAPSLLKTFITLKNP